ncbi:MAG: hypothetical protein K8S99_10390 [Planctomycetes bacterium]|nr:hypothetical protein [Planctomycetota bacterium]
MIRRRRNLMPPYEVMGSAGHKGAAAAPGPAPAAPTLVSRAPTAPPPRAGDAPPTQAWHKGAPIILRLPRGVVAFACVVALGVVILAYFVGYSIGYRTAKTGEDESVRDQQAALAAATGGNGATPATATPSNRVGAAPSIGTRTTTPPPQPAPATVASTERRKDATNYFILTTGGNRQELDRLAQFLAANGVDVEVIPAHNGRSFQVVALKGFAPEQLASAARRDYEKELRRLGRLWKSQNKGATDLADMYPTKYEADTGRRTKTGNTP